MCQILTINYTTQVLISEPVILLNIWLYKN